MEFQASFRIIIVPKCRLEKLERRMPLRFQDFVVVIHPRYRDFRVNRSPTFKLDGASCY